MAGSEAGYGRGMFHLLLSAGLPLCQPAFGSSSQQGGQGKTQSSTSKLAGHTPREATQLVGERESTMGQVTLDHPRKLKEEP